MIGSLLKRAINVLRPAGVVLLYHRVRAAERDPQLLSVRPEVFESHVAMLRRRTALLPLVDLVEAATVSRLPKRAVAITFDDGYADNLQYAKPILSGHGAPATVFAVSGAISQQTEFWWDTLERALLDGAGRGHLELDLGNGVECWELDGAADDAQWSVLSTEDPTPRHRAYRELMSRVKALSPARRRAVLGEALRQLGVPEGPVAHTRPLTASELRELAEDGLVDIGAHSVSHPQLSSMSASEQRMEMTSSRTALESIIGRPVRAFAYPYGSRADYTNESAAEAAAAGFSIACANVPGTIRGRLDRFQVPRVLVRNVPASALGEQLDRAFAGQF